MPATRKTNANPSTRAYKPYPGVVNGLTPNQCSLALPNTPDWKRPRLPPFDYGASSRYGQTYLSQGPTVSPVELKNKVMDYVGKAEKIHDAIEKITKEKEQGVVVFEAFEKTKLGNAIVTPLKNWRSYTYIEVYDEIVEEVPIRAWVRELDGPAKEVLTNMETLTIISQTSLFEPTRFVTAYDDLINSVQKLMTNTQDILTRFTTRIEMMKQSPKLEPIKKALRTMLAKWPPLTSAITHSLRVLRKLIPGASTLLDIREALENRANAQADPFSEEKRKKYVISVISVVTDTIIGLILDKVMCTPVGFCVGCVYLAASIGFAMDGGEGELGANALYALFPKEMTDYVMSLDSSIVQVGQWAISAEDAISSFLAEAKAGAIRAGNQAVQVGRNALGMSEELLARLTPNVGD